MSENLQCNKDQYDFPSPPRHTWAWVLLHGWDQPETGMSFDKGSICRFFFIIIIGAVTMGIPYAGIKIKAMCPMFKGCFILDIIAVLFDLLIIAPLFNRVWKSVQNFESKVIKDFDSDYLTRFDIKRIYRLKMICKKQSFSFFGILISIIILILTSFLPIITDVESSAISNTQDICLVLEYLKNIQHAETMRNQWLYCYSWALFAELTIVVFPISTFFEMLSEDLDYIIATRNRIKIYI